LKNSDSDRDGQNSGDLKCLEIRKDRLKRILTQFCFCDFRPKEFFNSYSRLHSGLGQTIGCKIEQPPREPMKSGSAERLPKVDSIRVRTKTCERNHIATKSPQYGSIDVSSLAVVLGGGCRVKHGILPIGLPTVRSLSIPLLLPFPPASRTTI